MVTNQILMDTLDKIYRISDVDFNVYTLDGMCISKDDVTKNDAVRDVFKQLNSDDDVQEVNDCYYFRAMNGNRLEYIIECEKTDKALVVGRMTALQIEALIVAYQERFDRDNFIKNLLLDNLLIVDIYRRAKKLHIDVAKKRVAFLVETRNKDDIGALETIRNMYLESEEDFVTSIDENNIVLVKEVGDDYTDDELQHIAEVLVDMMNTEAMSDVRVSYGNVADEIRKVSNSYKEAKMAMSIGKIFNSDRNVVSYASLGIGRLIYQLPVPMCRMFIDEIFQNQSLESFDEETLTTINQFFANSLNVSETSRQLYIHRNTLVYRLDKIQKNTGLDLREFEDAITFKIALMVVKYMKYMEHNK